MEMSDDQLSDDQLVQKALAYFDEKYGKLEEKDLVFKLSELPYMVDPFLTAINEKRPIAFIIPSDKPDYKMLAIDSLKRFKERNFKNDETYKEPAYFIYKKNDENRAYYNGHITPKGEVVVLVAPPCGGILMSD